MTIMNVEINKFSKEEIQAMREPQRETLRFLVEGEDGKAKFNAYRINPEDGIAYCNQECNKIFEQEEGILRLRVFSRISNTAYKEIARIERTKAIYFDELLLSEE